MPPRYAYWTILIGDEPTAFRAGAMEDILPTFNRLKEKQPTAVLKWFQNGKLWTSRIEAREAMEFRGEKGRRSDPRRQPGASASSWTGKPAIADSGAKPEWKPKSSERPEWKPKGETKPEWRPKGKPSSAAGKPASGKPAWRPRETGFGSAAKPEWKPRSEAKAEWRPKAKPSSASGKPAWKPKEAGAASAAKPAWKSKREEFSRTTKPPWKPRTEGGKPAWKPRDAKDEPVSRGARPDWKPKGAPRADWKPKATARPEWKPSSTERPEWKPKSSARPADAPTGRPDARDKKWRPGGDHKDPRQKYKDAKKAKWTRFKQAIRARTGHKKKRDDE